MRERRLVGALAVAVLGLAAGCGPQAEETAPEPAAEESDRPPNVVLIFVDDMGTEIGAYGNPVVETPNLDRLAREGMLFERAYTVTPSCSASRAALLTGRYPHANGVQSLIQWHKRREGELYPERLERTREHALEHDEVLISQHLKELGYATGIFGKWHISLDPVTEWGFDEYWAEPETFIREHRDEPFFYYQALIHTHVPFWTSPDFTYDPDQVVLPPYFEENRELREDLAEYYSAVSNQDREIGRILDTLDREGLTENTIVIFSSDNGPPYARAKATLYEWGIREPLIVRYPREISPGGRTDALASTVDVYPTLLELLGEPLPERLQGVSLAPVLRDPTASVREAVFAELNTHVLFNPMRAVRSGRWKYIRNFDPQAPFYASGALGLRLLKTPLAVPPRPEEELYDLETDPWESLDLANDPAFGEALAAMRDSLERWMEATGDAPLARERYIAKEEGYPGGWFGRPEDPAPNRRSPRVQKLDYEILKERFPYYAGVPEDDPDATGERSGR